MAFIMERMMVTMNELVENKTNKTYHFVYETTNNLNNYKYVGVHSTTDIDDGYLGSGTYLWRVRDKYGDKNFTRKILAILETRKDALDLEKKLVNREFVAREDTYNLVIGGGVGGSGVDNPMYGKSVTKETREKMSKAGKGRVFSQEHRANMSKAWLGHVHTKETREKISKANTGKVHSAESREKMSKSRQGVTYFNNGKVSRRVMPGDKIPDGFVKGMLEIECKFCGEKSIEMVIARCHGKGKCIK